MRIVLADPPAYTPPYDHELAGALARAGAHVELLTSPFRFGTHPVPSGYGLSEGFYRLSSRIRWAPLRVGVKAFEHPFGMTRLMRHPGDVLHLQWLAEPRMDSLLLRPRVPTVFTAHDILPRRTAHRTDLWRKLFARFDRIIVHSERGRGRLESFGVASDKLAVIPHPVFRSDPGRRDDGHTVLSLGVIRPYKGLDDTIAAVAKIPDARLLVAGDPRIPLDALRTAAGATAEWRLGYLGPRELEAALAETTVAAFPYRDELDQSGALLQVLGAGVPAVVYDVGGLGEVVAAYGAGVVAPAGDLEALTHGIWSLLADSTALAAARAGAERARAELTWDASARAHLALYESLQDACL